MNPEYMKQIFHKTAFSKHRSVNLEANKNHTAKYGNKSLRCLGLHIWNTLSNQIKKETDYTKFKKLIKDSVTMIFKYNSEIAILYYEYNFGFDPFLVLNGFFIFFVVLQFYYVFFCLFVISELYIYIYILYIYIYIYYIDR